MADSTGGDGDVSPSSAPRRRERAPTITIDTSAVSSAQGTPDRPQNPVQTGDEAADGAQPTVRTDSDGQQEQREQHQQEQGHHDHQQHQHQGEGSPTEVRPGQSLGGRESRESRPTSPHNVSSAAPTTVTRTADVSHHSQNFLSVPGTRSRGNSVDSDDGGGSGGNYSSSFGGDTYVASTPSGEQTTPDTKPAPSSDITKDENALTPDPGTEADFEVANNNFAFSPGQLNKMFNPKNLSAYYALGGLRGIERGLRTDRDTGLSIDETSLDGLVSFKDATTTSKHSDSSSLKTPARVGTAETGDFPSSEDSFTDRRRVFGNNKLPARKSKSIWELAWIAYNDNVLILLTAAAVVSLALGVYQSVTAHSDEPRVQWVEGVAIVVAIVVVVVVGAANDWKKERQFIKLNKKKEDRKVKIIRSGKQREISVYDVMAGDVMNMEPGDLVPADGVFISGHNVKCDESSATGESDLLRKIPGDEVYRTIESHEDLKKMDPFILSGSKISEGVGTFLVTSTGVHSSHGKTLMSLQEEGQTTPLQSKLNVLAEYIAKLGLSAGLLLFVVLFIKFLVHLGNLGTPAEKGQEFLQIFIVAVTIIVVAVPEGLPLAVTLALAFATTRMLRDNNLVRLLRACETMGNATTICSDKTGTLTQNKMSVVAGTFGTTSRFGGGSQPGQQDRQAGESAAGAEGGSEVSAGECVATLSSDTKNVLQQSIVLNSTAFEGEENGVPTFIGSKTETALLSFSREHLGLGSLNEERSNAEIVQLIPFDSGRKCMAVAIKLPGGKYRLLIKGASEILISHCTKRIADPTGSLSETTLTDSDRSTFDTVITNYASRSLRTIGMVYRDFEQWPPKGVPTQEDDPNFATFEGIFKDMTFLGVVGIQDPLRDGVAESVHICQKAGVFVRMVTGDNIITGKAIAQECGIFTAGGIAMEGPRFRKLSSYQMKQIIPRLQVLARSSPEDKKILVSQLQKLGETVAVTGDGTNDAPALKTADVGFSMGIAGTEVAKEASAIILMDDNFNSIVKAIGWGRTVNDAVKKFLQFQITVNITAVFLTFVSSVASSDEESVLTAVQLLWVNLIMDTLAALALATDPPNHGVLTRRPEPRSASLISFTMWKMIIGQSIYQLVVTFILNFLGTRIFNYDSNIETEWKIFKTLIFNTFVWMQIFNQYNARRIDNRLNIFEGIIHNLWFIGIQFVIVAGQVMIVYVGGQAFQVHRLPGREWAVSIILGVISIPVAVIIRLIPDELIQPLFPRLWKRKPSAPQVFVSDEDRRYEWNPAIEEIRDQLTFLKKVRGGRLRNLKYKLQHPQTLLPRSRSGSRSENSSDLPRTPTGEVGSTSTAAPSQAPPSPESRSRTGGRSRSNSAFGPAAAMAGIVAGSIGGWSPVDHGHGESDSLKFSGAGPHVALDRQQEGIEVHPETCKDDPIIGEYDPTSRVPPSQNPDLTPVFSHAPSHAPSHAASHDRDRRSTSRHSRESNNNNNNSNSNNGAGTGADAASQA